MKPVFFNSVGGTATRSSFAAKTPAELINCYLVFSFVLGTAQFERSRNRGASAANHGNFDRGLLGQVINSHNWILGVRGAERNIQHARDYVNRDDAGLRPRPAYRTVPTPRLASAELRLTSILR